VKRLYLQLYLTVVASLIVFALIAGWMWRHLGRFGPPPPAYELFSELVAGGLPPAEAPLYAQQGALERLSANGRIALTLYDADAQPIAFVGEQLPLPPDDARERRWSRADHVMVLPLPDGRTVAARPPPRGPPPIVPAGLLVTLGLLALGIAVGAYPVVRRVTRRLERLQASVDALGEGDLGTRVPVEGRDEVASLARSFNRAAGRIETLVGAHRSLLANASHELRSPLARVRMGIGLLADKDDARRDVREGLERDIAELDALIDEVLLASRLDAVPATRIEPVDLLGLAAEEGSRMQIDADGDAVTIYGDPRLLRRLIRNLLENARRHGGGAPSLVIASTADGASITVCDHGPGVPEADRDRVFEPFHRLPGTREGDGGAGLGLALVRQIARRHGGDARCLPNDGGGACFVATLARQAPRSSAPG
jgi:signal transduction histidine kinase